MTASAAMLALLMGCAKAPDADTAASTASADSSDTANSADSAVAHDEHATEATAMTLPRTPAPAGATVSIVSPKDGETVTTPVRVVFGVTGMGLAPAGENVANAGHHHLLVDTELANAGLPIPADDKHLHYGKAQTEAMVALTPGKHTLQLVMGDYLHIPFDPVIASQTITINVN